MRRTLAVLAALLVLAGAAQAEEKPPGLEQALAGIGERSQIWGVGGGMCDHGVELLSLPPIRAVAHFGKAAVPALRTFLTSGTHAERWDAIVALGVIGPDAAAAKDELLAAAKVRNLEEAALLALVRVVPDAPEVLALARKRLAAKQVPYYAVLAAGTVLPPRTSPNEKAVLIRLAASRPAPEEVTSEAWQADQDAYESARARAKIADAAAWALGRHGKDAEPLIPMLEKHAAKGGYEYALALERIGTPKARAIVLRLALGGHDEAAAAAVTALGHTTPVAEASWPALRKALTRRGTQLAVFGAIERLGKAARPLVPDLLKMMETSESAWERDWAVISLWETRPIDKKSVRALIKRRREDPDADVRARATSILRQIVEHERKKKKAAGK